MKYPPYAVFNLIVITVNIVLAIKYLFAEIKTNNVRLLYEAKLNTLLFLLIEILYFIAVYDWIKSGMDEISWHQSWIQQIFYILAENLKSLFIFLKLYTYNFRGKRK